MSGDVCTNLEDKIISVAPQRFILMVFLTHLCSIYLLTAVFTRRQSKDISRESVSGRRIKKQQQTKTTAGHKTTSQTA